MKENYEIFQYDSRNTGYYPFQHFYCSIKEVRDFAKSFAGNKYTIEGEDGFFELYEDGEKTEWSA